MTAYEIRISDWSSDVCSSDLDGFGVQAALDGLDALVQRRLVVVGQHGHRLLGEDRPGVDLAGRDVDRAAGDLHAVLERGGHGLPALDRGPQRGVRVQVAARERVVARLSEPGAEPGHDDEVDGVPLAHPPALLRVAGTARTPTTRRE